MTRPVTPAPLPVSPSLAAEAPVRRARLETGRSRGAPVLFGSAPVRAAPGPTLSRMTVEGFLIQLGIARTCGIAAWHADLIARAIGSARPPMAVGTAGLHVSPAGFHHSPIAPAGARQGLPTAIIKSGAAS